MAETSGGEDQVETFALRKRCWPVLVQIYLQAEWRLLMILLSLEVWRLSFESKLTKSCLREPSNDPRLLICIV